MLQRYCYLILLGFCMVFTYESQAQTLLNADFETWEPSGKAPPFDWEEPKDWSSTNPVTEFTAAGIRKNSTVQSGTFAAEIRTANVFGDQKPGILCNGEAPANFITSTIEVAQGGTPYSITPDRLRGFYSFTAATAGDSAYVVVLLKKYNTIASKIDTFAMGSKVLQPVATYTSFEVEINDMMPGQSPDSIVVAFYSSKPSNPLAGGVLLIDAIAIDINTSISDPAPVSEAFKLFPNPVADKLTIERKDASIQPLTVELYALNGKVLRTATMIGASMRMDVADLPHGVYVLHIKDEKHGKSWVEKVVR
ncbi:MAG: T9SS type A sorting domain-containing protein [Bacteroidia bacterium]